MDNRHWSADASGTPPTAPASPSVGYPSAGDPSIGSRATKGGAFWFHQIGEELRALAVENGLTPDVEDLTQIAKAVSVQSTVGATRYRKAAVAGCAVMIEI